MTDYVLFERFDTKKKKIVNGQNVKWFDYLIDIEKLKDSPKFREMIGFFNTKGVKKQVSAAK